MEEDKKKFNHSFTFYLLILCFIISVISLIVYLLELEYSDSFLFTLLAIIRYSSFMVFVCAFYKIALNIFRYISKRRKFRLLKLLIYLFFMIYGLGIFIFEAFIVVFSRGNV